MKERDRKIMKYSHVANGIISEEEYEKLLIGQDYRMASEEIRSEEYFKLKGN